MTTVYQKHIKLVLNQLSSEQISKSFDFYSGIAVLGVEWIQFKTDLLCGIYFVRYWEPLLDYLVGLTLSHSGQTLTLLFINRVTSQYKYIADAGLM